MNKHTLYADSEQCSSQKPFKNDVNFSEKRHPIYIQLQKTEHGLTLGKYKCCCIVNKLLICHLIILQLVQARTKSLNCLAAPERPIVQL